MLDLGDQIPANLSTIEVTDINGMLIDAPSLPVLTITKLATGTTQASPTDITVTHPTVGLYGLDQTTYRLPVPGLYELSWNVPGPNGGVYESVLTVQQDIPAFISTDDAVRHMRAANVIVQAADLDQLRWLCLVACRAIEADLGRAISRQTIVEEHDISEQAMILRRTPVISVTSVDIDGAVQDASRYRVDFAGILRTRYGWGFTGGWGWGVVTVTYLAGMTVVPEVLRKVALNAVQRMWQTSQNSPHPAFGDGGGGGEFSAADLAGQLGRLTPVEMGAYLSYKSSGFA